MKSTQISRPQPSAEGNKHRGRFALISGVTVFAVAALMGLGTSTATAATIAPTPTPALAAAAAPPALTAAQVAGAEQELLASNLPRTESTVDGIPVTTFVLKDVKFSFATAAARAPGKVTPYLGGGFGGGGIYISFNRVDQGALAVGAGAGLGVAICAIPAVGWVACALVATVIGIATYYVAAYGVCSSSRRSVLRIYSPNTRYDGCYAN